MARYFQVHPDNPQPRSLKQVSDILRDGGVVVWPTDSAFALGTLLGNREGLDRIRSIRQLDDSHHFTVVVDEFAKLGELVVMNNPTFRAIRAATPGPYTFIVPGTRQLPKITLNPKHRSVGVRIPDHVTAQALLHELGEPIVSSTLILPDVDEPYTEGWQIADILDRDVDAVLDSGDVHEEPTTVIDLTGSEPVILREGAGDTELFE